MKKQDQKVFLSKKLKRNEKIHPIFLSKSKNSQTHSTKYLDF